MVPSMGASPGRMGGCIPPDNPATSLQIFFMEMENFPYDVGLLYSRAKPTQPRHTSANHADNAAQISSVGIIFC